MTSPCLARPEAGATLVETLVAAAIVTVFFVTIFEVNAVCLRYIDASKEIVAAVQGVQDRVEGLRNLGFSDLISPSYMTALIRLKSSNPSEWSFSQYSRKIVP